MKRITTLASVCLLAALASAAQAQDRTVTGTATNGETLRPVPGVQVIVVGYERGTLTNSEGQYSLEVPADADSLEFRSLGYARVRRPISGTVVDVTLQPEAVALQGIVVTAMGVQRERSQLGTAIQQLNNEELNTTPTPNLVSQLEGKVSGAQIASSGTPGGSVTMVLRGANSLTGSNQPLFVVDGIPVSNDNHNGRTAQGRANLIDGFDYGNAISDLNPDDIETLTVLKGPNAAAIYGSQAANGAVVITTKKGNAGGIRTDVTLNYGWERPALLPDFQNQYGQGAGGSFEYLNGAGAGNCDGCDQSWGPRLDGQLIDQFTGPAQPWVAHPNNVSDFFDVGQRASANVAVSGGTETATARLSLGYDDADGYVPNNTFRKVSAMLSGDLKVNEDLRTSGSVQYIRNDGRNRPGTGYYGSIMEQFFWFGRQVDIEALRDYGQGGAANNGPANREYNWNYNYHNNPYWIQYENPITDSRDRTLASGEATYGWTDWLGTTLRGGVDLYRFDVNQQFAARNLAYADPSYNGAFTFIDDYNREFNTEFLANANGDLLPSLSVNAMAGAAARREHFETTSEATSGISVPGIYNVSNAAVAPTLGQSLNRRSVNSVFGSLGLTWNGWWTLEGTARNDWSSTLPENENSYFYPSLSTSVVLTDAFPALQSGPISFLKLRGSIAEVGSDAAPYQLFTTYQGLSSKFDGQPQFTLGNSLANAQLRPEITTSKEVGLEIALLEGRLSFDATYYDESTRDQIFSVPVSPTSGFQTRAINAGRITNRGIEALLSATPVELESGFRWNTSVTYARNRNQVAELTEGTGTIILGNGIFGDSRLEAREDKPYGAIFAGTFARDSATGRILVEDGIPVHGSGFEYLGSIQPDWTAGWSNDVRYGGLSLSVLFDMRRGGKIVSYTNMVGEYSGVLASSLEGREVNWDDPGYLVDGIDVNTGQDNEVRVTAEEYFQSLFGVMEPYVYDASYVKLREVRLGFDVPSAWLGRAGLQAQSVNIALTGRNLGLWTDVPNIDPEFAYSTGNFQGIEYAIPANARTIGISLRVTP